MPRRNNPNKHSTKPAAKQKRRKTRDKHSKWEQILSDDELEDM